MVGLIGLEPMTSSLSGMRSNHLSYRPMSRCPFPFFLNGSAQQKAPHLEEVVVGLIRLELMTSSLSGMRSNHLSYRPNFRDLEKFYDFAGNAEILAKREYFVNISIEKKFTLNCNIKLNTLS